MRHIYYFSFTVIISLFSCKKETKVLPEIITAKNSDNIFFIKNGNIHSTNISNNKTNQISADIQTNLICISNDSEYICNFDSVQQKLFMYNRNDKVNKPVKDIDNNNFTFINVKNMYFTIDNFLVLNDNVYSINDWNSSEISIQKKIFNPIYPILNNEIEHSVNLNNYNGNIYATTNFSNIPHDPNDWHKWPHYESRLYIQDGLNKFIKIDSTSFYSPYGPPCTTLYVNVKLSPDLRYVAAQNTLGLIYLFDRQNPENNNIIFGGYGYPLNRYNINSYVFNKTSTAIIISCLALNSNKHELFYIDITSNKKNDINITNTANDDETSPVFID